MAGVASVIEINSIDNTYKSFTSFEADGVKMHKHLRDDKDFVANIKVQFEKSQLIITKSTKFSDGDYITGILSGISNSFYKLEDTYPNKGQTELKFKINSIFRCKLLDFTKYIQMEKKN